MSSHDRKRLKSRSEALSLNPLTGSENLKEKQVNFVSSSFGQ